MGSAGPRESSGICHLRTSKTPKAADASLRSQTQDASKVIQFNLPFFVLSPIPSGVPILLSGLPGSTPVGGGREGGGRMGPGEKPGRNADSVKAHQLHKGSSAAGRAIQGVPSQASGKDLCLCTSARSSYSQQANSQGHSAALQHLGQECWSPNAHNGSLY